MTAKPATSPEQTEVAEQIGKVRLENKKSISALTLYLLTLAYALILLGLARIIFFICIAPQMDSVLTADLLKALYIGMRFDARWAAILTFPIGLAMTLPSLGRRLHHHKKAILLIYATVFFVVWTVYVFDAGFFLWLGERLNATILDLAEDFTMGAIVVWESYPVFPLGAGLLLLSSACAWPLARLAGRPLRPVRRKRSLTALIWLGGFIVFALAAYGQLSATLFPLRWSNAYFSPNRLVTALGLNPLQNLYDTYEASQDDGFDLEATRAAYPLMADYLGVDRPDAQKLNYTRFRQGARPADRYPNVVIIIMESLCFPKTSLAPGEENHTPHLRSLADESVLFTNFFANARTTARGIFSTITGITDVTESSTGSRNQRVIDQRVIADEFEGYDKFYMLGGDTAWANIRGIIGGNISEVRILEDRYWQAPNADMWGIADYDLFMEAHTLFEALRARPFLAIIQTASFHEPFTIPNGTPDFALRQLSKETSASHGFKNEAEYNSLRYADFSLGEFFKRAKGSSYYANTIFFILGDHGLHQHSANMSAPYHAAGLPGWHVPLIVHAPGHLSPAVRTDPAGQADIFPSAAGLAGIPYNNYTLGRDLFALDLHPEGATFISGKNNEPIRLLQDGYCLMDNKAGHSFLYRLADQKISDYRELEPERYARMRDLAWAFQHTSKYLLYNNKKQNQDKN